MTNPSLKKRARPVRGVGIKIVMESKAAGDQAKRWARQIALSRNSWEVRPCGHEDVITCVRIAKTPDGTGYRLNAQ